MKRKPIVITCPSCGKEYLPSELFIPKAFFGEPVVINRDENNKIINFVGTDMDTDETFCCDKCNKIFNIHTKISFNTTMPEIDFDSEYERKI